MRSKAVIIAIIQFRESARARASVIQRPRGLRDVRVCVFAGVAAMPHIAHCNGGVREVHRDFVENRFRPQSDDG